MRTAGPDYVEGLVSDQRPLSLNPLVGATDPSVRDVGELLYRRLLAFDQRALPTGDLALSYSVSPDGLTYQLPLRASQRWSDGRPITAADVMATVAFVQSPAFADPATAAPWQGVHVRPAPGGVVFDVAAPRASFAADLARLPILPLGGLSSAALAQLPRTSAQPMATSGPFRVTSATAAQIVLFPNPHAAAAPNLNQVDINLYGGFAEASAAFARGDIKGLLATDPVQRATLVRSGGTAHDILSFRFIDLLFNERVTQLVDPVVRQAIASTIDRGALVTRALQGLGAAQSGAIPMGFAWAQSAPSPTLPSAAPAPQAASTALAADGWKAGPDGVLARGGKQLRFTLVVADAAPLPGLAAAIAEQLRPLGIRVVLSALPSSDLLRAVTTTPTQFDLALADWDTGADPDVSYFWRSTAVPPAGFNVAGGSVDPFLDQALDRLATLSDTVARRTAAAAVSSQLADDLPAVFIATPAASLVLRPGYVVKVPASGDSGARFAGIAGWRRA